MPDDTTQTKLKEFQILLEKLVEYSLAYPATFVALLQQYPNGKQTYAKDIMSQTLRFLLFLLVGLYGARAFARVTLIPVTVLWPCVFVFSIVGAYALDQSMFDVWIAVVAGILGYFMRMYGFSVVPLAIGLILGGMLEQRLGQSMVMLDEKWWLMLSRPISLFFFILTALALFGRPVFQLINRTKATERGV